MTDQRLPPLPALRAFEMAARLGSFTHAAARLGLSQSAVTRQIAQLEASIGAKLFHRGRRGVELTAEGAAYFHEIEPAFELLVGATARMRARDAQEVVRLRVYAVFAMKWLIPRLASLRAWAPRLRLELDTNVELVDFERSALDAAIQLGAEPRPTVRAEVLMPDEIEPVCSPRLLEGGAPPTLDLLTQAPLLNARYRRADWPDWAASVGRPDIAVRPAMEFPSSVFAYQAAQEGLGIAIGQTALLGADLDRGLLVRPFRRPLRRTQSYELLTPASREPPRRVRAFRAWLLQELRMHRPQDQ